MKNYLSNKNEIARIGVIFAMIMALVAISYYYLINLTSDLRWVMMCGYFFVSIPAFFTLVHGAVVKRFDLFLLGLEFVLLGIFGFVAKLLHGIDSLVYYNYFFAAAYALSTTLVFSFADKAAFGKNLFAKWWFAVIMIAVIIGISVSVFVLPEAMVDMLILAKNIVYLFVNVLALALGVTFVIKTKNNSFWWAYSIYALFLVAAYAFQLFFLVKWYNLFLMLSVVSVPYVLMYAVRYEE